MTIYIGADHRGFALKEKIKAALLAEGRPVTDLGAATFDATDDYPDFAIAVGEAVAKGAAQGDLGIVVCGSGFGVDVTANKIKGIRAGLALTPDHIAQGRHDDDINVLALPSNFVDETYALAIVESFLTTNFAKDEERYARRIKKISDFEAGK